MEESLKKQKLIKEHQKSLKRQKRFDTLIIIFGIFTILGFTTLIPFLINITGNVVGENKQGNILGIIILLIILLLWVIIAITRHYILKLKNII